MAGPCSPLTRSRLVLPRAALTGCVRGFLWRDTRDAALTDGQRFNHFPAGLLCAITWCFEGRIELLTPHSRGVPPWPREPLPTVPVFGGPATGPLSSWNPGPAHALMLLLVPDALHRLTGLSIADWTDRRAPVDEVLPPDWQALCATVQSATDDDHRMALIEDFLAPRWAATRPTRALQAHRYLDWAQHLALQAATSAPGHSLRQVERRIKRWAGLPLRELRGQGRAELTFLAALDHAHATAADVLRVDGRAGSSPNWAELADAQGYADQSHLCRDTRRLTGFSPDELYHRIQEDESFWAYRLWG